MSGLYEQRRTEEVDNLSEYRVGRFAFYQEAIDGEYATFKTACETIKNSSIRMCELLRGAQQERIFAVDGYENMTQWVDARWPDISKSQLSRAILGGAILEEFDQWITEGVAKNGNLATLPRPENQGQLRALAGVEAESRQDVYELAVERAGGIAPSARVILETDAALNGKNQTDERIDRLDFEPSGKWIDARPASHEEIPNKDKSRDIRKPRFTEDIKCDGRRMNYQLIVPRGQGQTPLRWYGFISRNQWEAAGLVYKGKPQHSMDDEDFDADADHVQTTVPQGKKQMDPGVREYLLKEQARLESIGAPVLFADKLRDCPEEDEPMQGSFIKNNSGIAAEAMAKLFADEYSQDTPD